MKKNNLEFTIETGEEVVFKLEQSKVRVAKLLFVTLALIVGDIYLYVSERQFIWIFIVFLIFFSMAIRTIKAMISFFCTEYIITNKKVVYKYSAFRHYYDEVRLDKIENISFDQTLFGRIFNYGNVYVQGANMHSICFRRVRAPEDVKRKLNQLLMNDLG